MTRTVYEPSDVVTTAGWRGAARELLERIPDDIGKEAIAEPVVARDEDGRAIRLEKGYGIRVVREYATGDKFVCAWMEEDTAPEFVDRWVEKLRYTLDHA